ncbi:MAG: hypothetical protein HQL96_04660 [Magnetococcales bacterium]|nr:hypothetical protein [Magnetococcales bacterium]
MNLARILRPAPLPPVPQGSRLAWRLFLLALLLAVGVRFGLTALVVAQRPMPIDLDDSFTRIFQGVRNLHCFTQHCAALDSLRHQATSFPGDLSTGDYPLWDVWTRVSILSEPLSGLLITGLHALGLSLVQGHDLLVLLYPLLVFGALGYWLLVSFGPGPAGLALVLLTLMWDLGRGMILLPGEAALGLAMLAWARIRHRGAASAKEIFFLVLLMSGWHMIGKMWAVVTLMAYGWLAGRPLTGGEKKWLAATLAVLAMAFLLPPLLVSGSGIPTLDGITRLTPGELLAFHWPAIQASVQYLVIFYKHPWYLVILFGFGFLTLAPGERSHALFWLLLFAALLTASLIDHQPAHPGHLLTRIWVPFVFLLTGLIAHGIHQWSVRLGPLVKAAWHQADDTRNLFVLTLMLGFSLAMVDQFLFQVRAAVKDYPQIMRHNLVRHEHLLLPSQPARLLAQDPPCQDVLYTDTALVVYYLVHGAHRCGALVESGSDQTRAWIEARTGITHLVTWNPVKKHYGRLPATRRHPVVMQPEAGMAAGPWHIGLHNPGKQAVRVQLRPSGEEKELPPGWSGWWEVNGNAVPGQRMELAPLGEAEVLLTGLRIGAPEPDGLRWPWEQGITLDIAEARAPGGRRQLPFRAGALWPGGSRTVTVIDDTGSSVLATVHQERSP